MPVRKVAPNWGRSFQLAALQSNEQEVARVEVEHPQDFVVMLGNIGEMTHQFVLCNNRIQMANGGVADEQLIINSVRGTVLHVAARSVIVRSSQDPRTNAVDNTLRYHAQIAPGRPSLHEYSGDELTLTGATNLEVQLKPWTHSVKIAAYPAASLAAANYQVRQTFRPVGGAPVLVANFRDLAEFATPQPLGSNANTLVIAGVVAAPQVFFIVTQYWTL